MFPTEVKSQASGLVISIGLVSVTFVPLIVELANQIGLAPLFMLSFVSLIGFLFSFLLIETLNKPLLHTIN